MIEPVEFSLGFSYTKPPFSLPFLSLFLVPICHVYLLGAWLNLTGLDPLTVVRDTSISI